MTPPSDLRDEFLDLIDLDKSRVLLAPHITFVCGGPVDVTATTNHSIRNMFMNLSAKIPAKSEGFTLAENFKDWQSGYSSLSEFENDIAAISSIIVVILESAGSLAELGLFYANEKLRNKMVVIVHSEHHKAESFIKFGVLSPLEVDRAESVLVFEIDGENIENIEKAEVAEIVSEVFDISDKIDNSSYFDKSNHGHAIFLIFQIVDLFTILTSSEIGNYLSKIGINLSKKQISSALYILEKFHLIRREKRSAQTFYFVAPKISDRVEFVFKRKLISPGMYRRYDQRAIKLEVINHYEELQRKNRSFKLRLDLWKRRVEATS